MSAPPFEEANPLQHEDKQNTYRYAQDKSDYHGGRLWKPGELARQVNGSNQNDDEKELNY